ncbi:MAG TPA: ATP-binding protein [Acidimicrobiales bacterium]|nr:ATP-binding protein [Acidimicrobiales bacterium]
MWLVAVAGVVVALGTALFFWSRERKATSRVDAISGRLAGAEGAHSRSLSPAIDRLGLAVDRVTARLADGSASSGRLAAALDALAQGVVIADRTGRVVFRNVQAATFVGARHGDALVEQAVAELLSAGCRGVSDRRTVDLFGPPRRTIVVAVAPLEEGGDIIGALGSVDDTTERTRLEAVRTDFVANISHELKTPVGAIALLAETLNSEDDDEVRQRLTERMVHEAHRVGRTIDDLLELSRIEVERSPMREPVAVHLVIAEAVDRVRQTADLRGIKIDVSEPSPRLTVVGERRQLVSAIGNLLDNAIKYSDEGASIAVSTATDGQSVDIAVADQGIGIPHRDLERIFERFYRVDRARSRETGGTGLGLAIVRHVATNHGGEVRVQSQEGEGSTFTLTIPAGPGPVGVTTAAEAG